MKNIKLKSITILIITLLILYLILKDNFSYILKEITNINLLFFFIACVLFILYFLIDCTALFMLTKIYNNKIKISNIIKIGIETKFFNGITPLSTGGQPWQIYRLNKHNIKYIDGFSIVSQNYLLFQIAMIFITTIALLIFYFSDNYNFEGLLFSITIIGFLINLVILIFLLAISFLEKINYKIISFFIKIFAKLKFIKNYEISLNNWKQKCLIYKNNTLYLLKNKKILIFGIIIYTISTSIYYLIPYFILLSFGLNDISFASSFLVSALIFIAGCCFPIPGASGGMEYAYLSYFNPIINNETILFSTLIIWRLITFYLPTLIGGLVFCIRKK